MMDDCLRWYFSGIGKDVQQVVGGDKNHKNRVPDVWKADVMRQVRSGVQG